MKKRLIFNAVKEWLETYKKNSVKAATYDRLKISYRTMLKYPIADISLDELEATDIQNYLNRLVEDGYAITTIKKQFVLLTAYLKHEFAQGGIANPIYMTVKMPTEDAIGKPKREITTYSQGEQRRLLRVFTELEKRAYGVAVLMLETGLRVGEAVSISWSDIDWDRRALHVNKTLVRLSSAPTTFVQSSPKSKASRRTVPLSDRALDILEKLEDSAEDLEGFVFNTPGDPFTPTSYSSLEYQLKGGFKQAGVSYKGTHAFRHTFATNCYNRGCDVKVLSKLLGHADVSVTYNTYIHLYGDDLEEMRKVIG